jgi:hypothetical protein
MTDKARRDTVSAFEEAIVHLRIAAKHSNIPDVKDACATAEDALWTLLKVRKAWSVLRDSGMRGDISAQLSAIDELLEIEQVTT